jgi:DNA-binding transcriptional ArsR family regulator
MHDGASASATWSDPQALARALRALGHPTRIRAFAAFHDGELSPIDLVRRFEEPPVSLGAAAYHVQNLAAAGLIELSQTIHRRGAIEHRYALTVRGRAVARVLDELSGP